MAGLADIDVQGAVRKYLEQDLLVDREDEGADQSAEIQALLETIALSVLLYPQVVLSFLQRAQNALQQVAIADRDLIDYLLATFNDLDNPDDPVEDTSALVEAQAALVELDRLGRLGQDLQAYSRYEAAVQRFLDKQLASSLKRHGRGEFERSGVEARTDLFQAYAALSPVHQSMIGRLKDLAAGLTDFDSVDLTKLVSTKALVRVRSSLQQVRDGLDQAVLSKTVAAIELLSGAAALRSLTKMTTVLDPTVRTGVLPLGRTITAAAQQVSARAQSAPGPWAQPLSHTLSLGLDGASPVAVVLPDVPFVLGRAPAAASYTFPENQKLYLAYMLNGSNQVNPAFGTEFSAGIITMAGVLSALNTALSICATAETLNGLLVLRAKTGVAQLIVLASGPGSFGGGSYTECMPSAHEVLGFADHQVSTPAGMLSVYDLQQIAAAAWPAAVLGQIGNLVTVTSPSEGLASSLMFGSGMAALGFPIGEVLAQPGYLTLQENGEDISLASLGIFPGSRVEVSGDIYLAQNALLLDGDRIFLEGVLPRGTGLQVTITSPLVRAVSELLRQLNPRTTNFDSDLFALQTALGPLMGKPSLAQISDARQALQAVRAKVLDLLSIVGAATIEEARQQFASVASDIISGLQDRGLDQAMDLLVRGRFSKFFGLAQEAGASGTRFLSALEDVGRNELATSTDEDELDQGHAVVSSNPNTQVFPSVEQSD